MLEQKRALFDKYKFRAMNSGHEVVADTLFSIFVSNFSAHEGTSPKNAVVSIVARSPIANITVSGHSAQELCGMIYICPLSLPVPTQAQSASATTRRAPIFAAHVSAKTCRTLLTTTDLRATFIRRASPPPCPHRCSL